MQCGYSLLHYLLTHKQTEIMNEFRNQIKKIIRRENHCLHFMTSVSVKKYKRRISNQ